MIIFKNNSKLEPFKKLKKIYQQALSAKQQNIEAISISSFSKISNIVNSRYVNLKYVDNEELIFFTNYSSPKAEEFSSHPQITALIYWNSINTQIRMRADIKKTTTEFNKNYFKDRNKDKNALAISSRQSSKILSHDAVIKNFQKSLKHDNLEDCPEYWGGYIFKPYYFEFWEGHPSRLNKREFFVLEYNMWRNGFLQP